MRIVAGVAMVTGIINFQTVLIPMLKLQERGDLAIEEATGGAAGEGPVIAFA
jgi:hypothetical protein